MALEIERKFLVRGDAWRAGAVGRRCRQAYLNDAPGATVRVRVIGAEAYVTLKGQPQPAGRLEFEYPIPLADAETILAELAAGRLIDKTRYDVPYAGQLWEVDVFAGANAGLIIAEVELERPDEHVTLPPWVGAEVTADPRYQNSHLARRPFTTWPPAPA